MLVFGSAKNLWIQGLLDPAASSTRGWRLRPVGVSTLNNVAKGADGKGNLTKSDPQSWKRTDFGAINRFRFLQQFFLNIDL